MKRILVFLFVFSFSVFFAQNLPDFINYQLVARDTSGNILAPSTPLTINIKLYDSITAPSASYAEDHNITVPATGIINLKVGKGSVVSGSFSAVYWESRKVSYEVSINGVSMGGKQTFAAVPYAYYALKSGNGGGNMVPGSAPDQTLFWDDVNQKWVPSTNLSHDGNRVGIGVTLSSPRNKLHVTSASSLDSSVVYATKLNAGGHDATYRGYIVGSTNAFTANPLGTSINGGEFTAVNNGSGFAIGSAGFGISNGTGIGIAGIAGGALASTLIGVYGSVETSSPVPNSYAAFFNKGNVAISDTLIFPNEPSSSTGYVLQLNSQKRAVWTAPPSVSGNWSINGNSGTNASTNFLGTIDNNGLSIRTNGVQRMFISPTGSIGIGISTPINPLYVYGTNAESIIVGDNAMSTPGSSMAVGVYGRASNSSPLSSAIRAEHIGGGNAILASAVGNTAAIIAVNQNSTGTQAYGIYGVSFSSAASAVGVYGENKGGGNGIVGMNSNSLATNVAGVHGVADFSNTNAGLFGEGYGSAVAVKGVQSNSNIAIIGTKPLGTTIGSAGRFEIMDANHNGPSLHGFTNGTGPAIQASTGTITTSALSLVLEGGHVRAMGPLVTIIPSATGNFYPPTGINCTNCNDVKGKLSCIVTFSTSVGSGDSFSIEVDFTKPYSNVPTVVVSPTTNMDKLDYFVSNVTTSKFIVTFINNGSVAFTLPSNYSFNYFVIE